VIITVTHLTRMAPGYICVAGIDHATGQHVRPVMQGRLSVHLSATRGGPFNMGEVADLGPTRYVGAIPEIEDHDFDWRQTRALGAADPDELWEWVLDRASASLKSVFGTLLRPHADSCVIDPGQGVASLGYLLPRETPRLFINRNGRLRMALIDGEHEFLVSVTDLRLCDARFQPDPVRVAAAQQRIARGVPLALCVGLTRPFQRNPTEPAYHWLQVNNLHFADDLGWRLTPGPAGWREDDDSLY
jgi:hypothetical protein